MVKFLIISASCVWLGLVVYGRSLGAAVALELASRTTPRAVIIESSFTSVADMAATIYPYLPTRLLVRHAYPNLDSIKKLTAPVLIAHSENDEMIPFSHGQALFENAPAPNQLYRLHGSHNEAFVQSGQPYYRALAEFIATSADHRVIDDD